MGSSSTRNMSAKGLNVVEHGNALELDPNRLEATRNFFYSNSYGITVENGELHIFFAQASPFLNKKINMAIEVVFPIKQAADGLFESIFIHPSTKGTQSFYTTLSNSNKKSVTTIGSSVSDFNLNELNKFEPRPENFRQINANYARFAYALNEGMIEFYEANPIFIHSLSSRAAIRDNDGIHSVFAVITSTFMLEKLLGELKSRLEPIHSKLPNEEEVV